MDYALSRGVNFFDTAELYPVPPTQATSTLTEKIIGNWMEARGNREQVCGARSGGPSSFLLGLACLLDAAHMSMPAQNHQPDQPISTQPDPGHHHHQGGWRDARPGPQLHRGQQV